jgi:hypothetical protein
MIDRDLENEQVEGEIGLVIDYKPGQSRALDVLGGAMALIQSLDDLDRALLSSVNTELEPVSILNDVQHSSLKLLLARVLKKVPDEHLNGLEWKKWVGGILVKGKHGLLKKLDADAPQIAAEIAKLEPFYKSAPGLAGYEVPRVQDVQIALKNISRARSLLPTDGVVVQTELGDIVLPYSNLMAENPESPAVVTSRVNRGREFLKIRYADMLGRAQWTVLRNGKNARVDIMHQDWLNAYHQRTVVLLPGDSIDCTFEETVDYDAENTEINRRLSIVEVHSIHSPPSQRALI